MEVIIQPTSEAASAASLIAARLMARQIRNKTNSVVGLATGGNPMRLHERLVALTSENLHRRKLIERAANRHVLHRSAIIR